MPRYWRTSITIFLIPLAIFLANLFLVLPLFSGQFTQWTGSIETAFIAQAKFVVEHFPHLSFFPYWYTGFPFSVFHTPLLVTSMVLLSKAISFITIPASYRIITGLSYSLVPVSLYFLGRKLGKSFVAGLITSLFYSFWPSGSLLTSIVSSPKELTNVPWQFIILSYYGEGPHTLSLVFLPLAALFFWKALENPSKKQIILASLFTALCALTSTFGLISLILLISAMTIIKSFTVHNWSLIKIWFAVGLVSLGLSAFWYNLLFFKNLFAFSDASLNLISGQFTMIFFIIILSPILLFGLYSIIKHFFPGQEALSSLLVWSSILYLVPTIWEKTGVVILPQAIRYAIEFDLGIALIVGVVLGILIKYLYSQKYLIKLIPIFLIAVFLGLSLKRYLDLSPKTRAATQAHQDITKSIEYKTSQWIKENVGNKRVYLTGNYSFWLNTFVKTPQLRGGGEQAVVNPWIKHAAYQINTGSQGDISLAWLKIFNISNIVVNLASSPNRYKDYKTPSKFSLLGKPVFQEHGDQLYNVPLKDPSMAKVVSLIKVSSLEKPKNGIDEQPINEYVAWLEEAKPGQARLKTIDNDHYQISANLNPGEAILVHFSYDPGWKAKSNLGYVEVRPCPLGQLLLVPNESGEQTINLSRSITIDHLLGYGITLLTILFLGTKASRVLNFNHAEDS